VILDFPHAFPADETERRVPDVAAAIARVDGHEAPLEALLAALRGGHAPGAVRQVVEQWADAKGDLRGFVER